MYLYNFKLNRRIIQFKTYISFGEHPSNKIKSRRFVNIVFSPPSLSHLDLSYSFPFISRKSIRQTFSEPKPIWVFTTPMESILHRETPPTTLTNAWTRLRMGCWKFSLTSRCRLKTRMVWSFPLFSDPFLVCLFYTHTWLILVSAY